MKCQQWISLVCVGACVAGQLPAQEPFGVTRPQGRILIRSYQGATVAPVRLHNSDRLHSLIRAGKLYLTVQDAVALAVENNLDLEIDRYGPLNAEWSLQRAQAGGPLRGVTSGNSVVNQATGGQGVVGSQQSAGVSSGGSSSSSGNGGATVSQIGPVVANLDPVLQNTTAFSHATTPQPNPTQSQVAALVDTRHVYNTLLQQGLISGGYVQVTANESYLKENTPTDILNPSVAPVVQIYARHNFLNGFGRTVNTRFIRVAERNQTAASETFRSQLLNLVASVLNQYWDLAASLEDLKGRERAQTNAQKFYEDTRNEIRLGVLANIEIYRAEAELATRKQELAIAQATVRQNELVLKNSLSRDGLADPVFDAAEVVPLDKIQVPEQDDLPPLRELVTRALAKRPDVVLAKINDETADISAIGTKNGLLPVLQGIASTAHNGLAGVNVTQPGGFNADPYYLGGLGTALGQVFRRNFYTARAAVSFQASLGNRIAQGDYGVDQLQLQQQDLVSRKNMNQIVVDISNQMVAFRQASARHRAAVTTRTLQEQLLEKTQQRFSLGVATISDIISAQRSLVTAQTAEVNALAAFSRARVSLDQVLGQTLETNHVSVEDALAARIAK